MKTHHPWQPRPGEDAAGVPEDGRFVLRRVLGTGATGIVYEALDRARNEVVALKLLRRIDPSALYRFKNEFRALADLNHPNLVTLFELGSIGDEWFLSMELIDGIDFTSHVRPHVDDASAKRNSATEATSPASEARRPPGEPSSSPGQAAPSFRARGGPRVDQARLRAALAQLAQAVVALHRAGKLHRDIKPSNVLVTRQGRVVLCDFGLVREVDRPADADPTLDHHVVGTPVYMSPEQAAGRPLDEGSDWYSVGVMLYEALAGRLPFDGERDEVLRAKQLSLPAAPSTIDPGVAADLDGLCLMLLETRPEARPSGEEVLARIGGARVPAARATATSSPVAPLVGRASHLDALRDAFAAVRTGHAVIACVEGSSGMGKTALIQRFAHELEWAEDAVVLRGRCFERESVPYKGLDSLIDALAMHLMHRPQDQVATLLPPNTRALARLFPVLSRVPAVADAPRGVLEAPDPVETRRRAAAALRQLVTNLAVEAPMVLCLDDLQWGDRDSAALLDEMTRPPAAPPILLVASYRADDKATSPFLQALATWVGPDAGRDLREVAVGALSEHEAGELAGSLLGSSPDAAARAGEIAVESRGNAFLIGELVRHARTGLSLDAGARMITLDGVVRARLDHLSGRARDLLTTIAVAGGPVAIGVAMEAAGSGTWDHAALSVLRAEHLIRSRGTRDREEVEVYHDRIRESVVGSLSPQALRQQHRQLALALQRTGHADPEMLVEHWLGAGAYDRAAELALVAADRAATTLAFDRAARLYRLVIDLLRPAGEQHTLLHARLADALVNAGRGREAATAYTAAATTADTATALRYRASAAEQLLLTGHIDAGMDALRDVLEAVGMKLPASRRRALASLLWARLRARLRGLRFRPRDASQVAPEVLTRIDVCWAAAAALSISDHTQGAVFRTRHLLESLRAGQTRDVTRALALEGVHLSLRGVPARRRAEAVIRRAARLAEEIDAPLERAWARGGAGQTAYQLGRWREALEACGQAERVVAERCTGGWWELSLMRLFTLWALYYLGEAAELARRVPQLAREADERGDLYHATTLRTGLPNAAWLLRDDVDGARRAARGGMHGWSQRGYHLQHYWSLLADGHIELYADAGQAAWDRVRDGWAALEKSMFLRIQTVRIEALHLRGRAAIAAAVADAGRRADLLRFAERDARRLARERVPHALAMSCLQQAGVASARGDSATAQRRLTEAIEWADQAEMALYATVARWRLGGLITGDAGRALVASAEQWMRGQEIASPASIARLLAPGFDQYAFAGAY